MKKRFLFIASILVLCSHVRLSAQNEDDVQKAAAAAAAAYAAAPVAETVAPKPKYWTTSLETSFNFLQTGYSNWAKGGYNNIKLGTFLDGRANYKKNDFYWNNRLQMEYGFFYSEDKPILQKNRDKLQFESTFGHTITKTMSYTAKYMLQSQFSNSYNYQVPSEPADPDNITSAEWRASRVLKSGFFSPANMTLGGGIDWNPSQWLKVNFSPVTGGIYIVMDSKLRKSNGMKRKKGYEDLEAFPDKKDDKGLLTNGHMYQSTRFQFGSQLTMDANLKINDNFTAGTQVILFSDYLNKPQNIRVNWNTRILWKLAKYFTLAFNTDVIYDDLIVITNDKHPDGIKAVQLLQSMEFGFTYTFHGK